MEPGGKRRVLWRRPTSICAGAMSEAPRRAPFAILIACTAIGPMSMHILLPSLPGMQRVFATDFATVQLALTLYLVGLAMAQLIYGPLSDRFGRRPVLLAGLGLYLGGSLICLLAPTIGVLIAGRVVQAVGGCAGLVLGRAIVRDLFERERAASMLAYVTMAMVVAPMLSPTIGGFLDVWFGWRAIFIFLIGVAASVLVAVALFLPETHNAPPEVSGPFQLARSFGELLRQRAFCGYAFSLAFTTGVWMSFVGGAPYITIELLGRSPYEYGLYFIGVSAVYAIGNYTAGRISQRVGSDRMITSGNWIAIAGAAMLVGFVVAGALNPFTLFFPVAVLSFGQGLSIPNAIAGAVSVDPRRIGAASGLAGFLQMAIAAGCSYLVGALLAETAVPMVAIMMVLAILAHAASALVDRI